MRPIPRQSFPVSHPPLVIPRQLFPISHSPSVIPRQSFPISHSPSVIPHRSFPIGHSSLVIPHQSSPVSHSPSVIPHQSFPVSHSPSVIPHQSFPVSRSPSVIPHRSFIVSHSPSVIPHQSSPLSHSPSLIPHHSFPISHPPSVIPRQSFPVSHSPSVIPHQSFPISHSPSVIPRQSFPVSHSPSVIPRQLFPIGHSPSVILHRSFPISHSPSVIPHKSFPISHSPPLVPPPPLSLSHSPSLTPPRSFPIGHSPSLIPRQSFSIGHSPSVIPHRSFPVSHSPSVIPHRSFPVSHSSLVIPRQSFPISHSPLVIPLGHPPSIVSHSPLIINFALTEKAIMISKDTIEEVKNRIDIVEVVSDFLSLKKSGKDYKALSPFAHERTPSFFVVPSKGIFKDFSSGKGGDAITFVMEHEKMSYSETIRYLAAKYGVEIKEDASVNPEEFSQQESLYIAMGFARDFFQKNLTEKEEGQIGLNYFQMERRFSDAIIRKFELGYALQGWDLLMKEALKSGYGEETLEKSGLIVVKEEKRYDRFRGRVMFPVHNLSGKVIAFGARMMGSDPKQPKYLNSPETEIYSKGEALYGIYQSRNAIRQADLCYLVEGYTDVISMHQAGVENVVSSSGTSLTEKQIR